MADRTVTARTSIMLVVNHQCGPWGEDEITMGELRKKAHQEASEFAEIIAQKLRGMNFVVIGSSAGEVSVNLGGE